MSGDKEQLEITTVQSTSNVFSLGYSVEVPVSAPAFKVRVFCPYALAIRCRDALAFLTAVGVIVSTPAFSQAVVVERQAKATSGKPSRLTLRM